MLLETFLLSVRRAWRKLTPPEDVLSPVGVELTGQRASNLIRERLESPAPAMIARFGAGELTCLRNYLGVAGESSLLRRSIAYVRGKGGAPWWEEDTIEQMMRAPGFFPRSVPLLERFSMQLLEDAQLVDVLGSWLRWEAVVAPQLRNAVRVTLQDLEPYYHGDPWTEALQGTTVLVVHPFSESIAAQYARRSHLFRDPRMLPEFELKTLQAVQSIAETETRFPTWFDAFDFMRDEMSAIEFDIALIGAGAYGFSLAAHAKRLGKKAVHLGGATQILFGIKGRRWDDHPVISRLYNEHWVRPLASERPVNYRRAEGGSYW